MTTRRAGSAVVAAFAASLGAMRSACMAQTITGLGFLPGDAASSVDAASANGDVVFGQSWPSTGNGRAFRWTMAGGMEDMGTFGFPGYTGVNAVSADGSVVAGSGRVSSCCYHGFIWTSAGGFIDLGAAPGGTNSYAIAMSADGSVVVGNGAGRGRAWRWTTVTGMTLLPIPPGYPGYVSANGISADGSVIVGMASATSQDDTSCILWTAAGPVAIGHPDGEVYAEGRAISGDGLVVAGPAGDGNGNYVPFRWTQSGGMSALPGLADVGGLYGWSSNYDGSVIVFGHAHSIWTATQGWVDATAYLSSVGVNMAGWVINYDAKISSDGSVLIGGGTHNGVLEAFIATLPPVSHCGSADFNHDGDTATDADIEAFFRCLAGNCCATCDSADFNGDGDTATDADIEAFFRVLAGGTC